MVPLGSGQVEVFTERFGTVGDEPPRLYVLEFVGNAERADFGSSLPEGAVTVPAEVWRVNYPGFGGSTGPARLRSIPRAASAVYTTLARQAHGRPIVVYGNSLGATTALYVAAHHPVRGGIYRNPPPLVQLIMGRFGWWNLWLGAIPVSAQIPRSLDAIRNARRATSPGLFLMSERDEVVPTPYQEEIYCSYRGPKRVVVMQGRRHNTSLSSEAAEAIRGFLRRTVR
jgi:pimeloyl-ACP methyl ester carboxylesterase